MAAAPHILVLEARFYEHISDALLQGAKDALTKAGATFDVVTVPGILELPAAALFGIAGSNRPLRKSFNGFVALGCAIKGETDHYEHVCREAMSGVTRIALDFRIPAGNGILTCPTEELAVDRANPASPDGGAGGRAGNACLRLIEIKRRFGL